MKHSKYRKRRLAEERNVLRGRLRELDRHDRAYLLSFLRDVVHTLASDANVDSKLSTLAGVARRLAPSIATRRALLASGEKGPVTK